MFHIKDFRVEIRIGKVVLVNADKCSARVQFLDIDNFISVDLPILQRNTQNNKDYNMVDIDEQVVCVLFENTGVILGSIYNRQDTPHFNSQDVRGVQFDDGTEISYDRDINLLNVDINGQVTATIRDYIKATIDKYIDLTVQDRINAVIGDRLNIRVPTINIEGNTDITIDNSTFTLNNTSTKINSSNTHITGDVNLGVTTGSLQIALAGFTQDGVFGVPISPIGASKVKASP